MKKIILLLTMLLLMAMLVGCASATGESGDIAASGDLGNANDIGSAGGVNTDPVSGVSEEQAAMLEKYGVSMEEFNQMPAEQQQALLDELGVVAGAAGSESTQAPEQNEAKQYTTADVAAGGKYVVRIGDGRLNNYYLYYEDGKLVKVEISFQKNDEEEPETYLFEGDTLNDFWYIDKSLDELIDYFDQQDYGYTHTITRLD